MSIPHNQKMGLGMVLAGTLLIAVGAGAGALPYRQVFGEYNSTLPTVTDTEVETIQIDSRGRLIVAGATGVAFVDSAAAATSPVLNASDELIVDPTGGISVLASDIVSSATDAQLVAAGSGLRMYYFSIMETAGSTAEVWLRNGTGASDEPLVHIRLAANESRSEYIVGGLNCADGLYFDRVSGTVSLTVGTQARNR